ncbi:hypothetical protein KIW84_076275 [Lathyrus oleraceus]|uniref:Reverse transcriptase zinc-binding domain-containing protein n=1 Tax=Pisum sativum TaxID=3888 RepID=A0A9D4VXE3_PEA|nr:hypothetical protein KIW84_076275 [Pisum sativum]
MKKEAIWLDTLELMYGDLRKDIMFGSSEGSKKKSYTWWKDLISSDYNMAGPTFSFSNNINFRVDDVMSIFFWNKFFGRKTQSPSTGVGSGSSHRRCDVSLKESFCSVWKTHSPFKVRTFVWRCFLNRISTKDQLRRRGLLHSPYDFPCTLCFQVEEDLGHLFFNCRVADVIWKKVVDWIQIDWVNEALLWKSFSSWDSVEKFKMLKKGNECIV